MDVVTSDTGEPNEVPDVAVLSEPWGDSPGYQLFSPSQIATYTECARKWGWRRIAKIYPPPGPSAELGTRVHAMLEDYLRDGTRPDFVKDLHAANIASSGLHLLPEPKTPGVVLERDFRFQSPRTQFVYGGFKDVEVAPGVPLPMLGLDGSAPVVIDHKTSSSIASYAKTPDDLRFDAQAIIYGYDSMARFGMSVVDLSWGYLQTKGASRAEHRQLRLESSHAAKVFDAIESVAEEAADALVKKLEPLDLPPNPSACGAYGGCPYRHLCNLSPSQSARSRMSNSIIAGLRARVQNQQAAPTTPAPSVMGCAAEDVPAPTEIPAAFRDAPAAINPPEGNIPPPPVEAKAEEPKPAKAPRAKKEKAAPASPKIEVTITAPAGVDAKAFQEKILAADTTKNVAEDTAVAVEKLKDFQKDLAQTREALQEKRGFTLYVDCMPIGRPARAVSRFMSIAHEEVEKILGVPDYRLADYGKGAPVFVAAVLDQVGTEDLFLDTRSPEGAVLLEALSAKASFVVRGIR